MLKKKLELNKLIEVAVGLQRHKDENPDVGAAFFELEESIQEAADKLGIIVSESQVLLLIKLVDSEVRKPRLMEPPGEYNR